MGRAFGFVISGVLMMVSVIIHLISVELFAADKPLYSVATDGTAVVNGSEHAALWSEILMVWMPFAVFFSAFLWVTIREYRRQVQTAAGNARPPG